jgi:hypothetical protein
MRIIANRTTMPRTAHRICGATAANGSPPLAMATSKPELE